MLGVETRMNGEKINPLKVISLNHISLVCRSMDESIKFYQDVLGFQLVKRPGSLKFAGAWLYGYGIGIHFIQAADPKKLPKKTEIDSRDQHISFQCESMVFVEKKLKELGIKYLHNRVEDHGIYVDQLFFHDPDGFMIEVCDCENIPVIPLAQDTCSGTGKPLPEQKTPGNSWSPIPLQPQSLLCGLGHAFN